MDINKIYNEDCLIGMQRIPDVSVDAIICDLPYGTTQNKWDSIIPLDKLWEQYKRIIKVNGVIVLFSQQPFTSILYNSNPQWFRYEWIWEKDNGTGFMNANKMPMKIHENILVFYNSLPTYNPQRVFVGRKRNNVQASKLNSSNYNHIIERTPWIDDGYRMPIDIIRIGADKERYLSKKTNKGLHPTQKPVDLLRYLVLTYTNPGDLVLDNCMGSGTTAIACIKEKRNFIGFEMNTTYYEKSLERIKRELSQPLLF